MLIERSPLVSTLLATLLLGACSPPPITVPPRLQPLVNAPLLAGEGLGDLRLGATTLAQCVASYGIGKPALLAGDEYAIELRFVRNQLVLTFSLGSPQSHDWSELKRALRDLESYVYSHPECRDAPLAQITIRAGASAGQSFYEGRIGDVAPLFAPRSRTQRLGPLTGDPSPDDGGILLRYPGLTVRCERPEGGDEDEPHRIVQATAWRPQPAAPR